MLSFKRVAWVSVWILWAFAGVCACGADSVVTFNEMMYHPADDASDVEWVEIYNDLSYDVDLSSWSLQGGVQYTFADGTSIGAQTYLVVASDPEALRTETTYNPFLGPFEGRLANGGEELRLVNADGRLMDAVRYADGGEWPVAPDGSGASLAKIEPRSASAPAQNWTWSSQKGGTPGGPNASPLGSGFQALVASGAPAWAHVPTGDYLGTSWTLPSFSHWNWLQGPTGVGYETRFDWITNYASLARLDLLQEMRDKNQTCYIRVPFTITDPKGYTSLTLRMKYDAGFVAYINGVEAARANVGGPLAWNSGARRPHYGAAAVTFEDFNVSAALPALQPGRNVLAIHGLNEEIGSPDFIMLPELHAYTPGTGGSVVLNEVAPADAQEFWVEIVNSGDGPVDLAGWALSRQGDAASQYVFPAQALAAGGFVVVREPALGFAPVEGDRLFLEPVGRSAVADSIVVPDSLHGRYPDATGGWVFPTSATPGEPNVCVVEDAIVINEIMYHQRPQGEEPGRPAVFKNDSLVAIDSTWKYEQSGNDLGASWKEPSYADGAWPSGPGALGVSLGEIPAEILTPLNSNGQTTFYFRTAFDFEGTVEGAELQLNGLVDDGAIFYLNGVEILRLNMPEGPVHYLTTASESVRFASFSGPIAVASQPLVNGKNVLAAELHRVSATSRFAVFGAALQISAMESPPTSATAYAENPEEWIEFYNRSDGAVDLSGWSIADAVDFAFPQGTVLDPDRYLIVSNDADALRARFPEAEIIGNCDRALSNGTDRIALLDAGGKVADEVRYFEDKPWPYEADGYGASLELRDPRADNSKAEAWAPSDEAARSEWETIAYRGPATQPEGPSVWQELVIGLLDAGEVLLDDISVIEDPSGLAAERIKVGGFEIPYAPKVWRFNGTHQFTEVIEDPDDPGNHVMHVVATGATLPNHNNIETTLNDGIRDGREYEISLRARWLSGSNQLNLRLYHNRLQRTFLLKTPDRNGTPGARNSRYEENIGPTFSEFGHFPVVPNKETTVTVTAAVCDPDGVSTCTLFWALNGDWTQGTSVTMTAGAGGRFAGAIAPHDSAAIVQFYVAARDTLGATAFYPPGGREARALYQVDDGLTGPKASHTYRIIMTKTDSDLMLTPNKRMSNHHWGGTLIDRESDAYYDIGVRQKGGAAARPSDGALGFQVSFHVDRLYRGVHPSAGIDRSTDSNQMFAETCGKHLFKRGLIPAMYDDLVHVIAPRRVHGIGELMMSSYGEVFIESQWENGSDGTLYNFDLQYIQTATEGGDPEGLKITNPYSHEDGQIDLQDLGEDKESYRWWFLIKNNRQRDDYKGIMAFCQAMSLPGEQLEAGFARTADRNEVLRFFGMISLCAMVDMYTVEWNHNLRLYARPGDGRIEALPWDLDGTFGGGSGAPLWGQKATNMKRVIERPGNKRLYLGHMRHLISTAFSPKHVGPYIKRYADVIGGVNYASSVNFVRDRSQYVLAHLPVRPEEPTFAVTFSESEVTTRSVARIEGRGWIDFQEVRLNGNPEPVELEWRSEGTDRNERFFWRLEAPVAYGQNVLEFTPYDFSGNALATRTVTVHSTYKGEPQKAEAPLWILY